MLAIANRYRSFQFLHFAFPLSLLAIAGLMLRDYLGASFLMLLVGIVAIVVNSTGRPPARRPCYAWAAGFVLLLAAFVPVKTLLFFAVAFSLFYWLEQHYTTIGCMPAAALLLSSAAFEYLAAVFSFPIRLQLASWVSSLFSLWRQDVQVRGNVIFHDGHEFAVDPACMGLHMLAISLLIGITLIGALEQRSGRRLPLWVCITYLLLLFALNIVANLLRMLLLVSFVILPGTLMHEVAGLACLLVYVCLPAGFVARWMVRKNARPYRITIARKPSRSWLSALLLAGLVFTAVRSGTVNTYAYCSQVEKTAVTGYAASAYAPGIVKLEKPGTLLYVKFIRSFYDTEHHPGFCWKGSGYEFRNIQLKRVADKSIYTALLVKGSETLYTAWWYGNGRQVQHRQWAWRWDMMRGAPRYAVINLTTAQPDELMKEAAVIIKKNSLQPLFSSE